MVDMGCITEDRELIETLWNVNVEVCQPFDFHFNELIETLWNVNSEWYGMSNRQLMN